MRVWQAGKKREAEKFAIYDVDYSDGRPIVQTEPGQAIGIKYKDSYNWRRLTGLDPVFRKGDPIAIGDEICIVAKDAYGGRGTVEVHRF